MAQTLGQDVPFVTLTGSEVFSLEVSYFDRVVHRSIADTCRCQKRRL